MWPDGETESGLGRASSGSEVVIMDERMLALANASSPSQVNVTGSNLVHVGPKFVSVNQTVHNREVVKGRFLGRELISPKKSTKLRCSIMVFVCWAVVVASGFSFYLVQYIFLQQTRLDLDIKEWWYLRRSDWLAMPPYELNFLNLPVGMVIIGHSATDICIEKYKCISLMLEIQHQHLDRGWGDIGPNFLVSGNGLIFEGRGANVIGAMIRYYNSKSITIMFIGDYTKSKANHEQFEHLNYLLDVLVKERVLLENYEVFASCQKEPLTISPGPNIISQMSNLSHWTPVNTTGICLDFIAKLNDRCGDEDSAVLDIISLSSRNPPGVCQSPQLSPVQRPKFMYWTPRGYSTIGRDSRDLSLPMYLWSVLKSTTRAERLSCAAAIIFLTICVTLIIVYVLNNKKDTLIDKHDKDDWNISRIKWLAQNWETKDTTKQFEPLRLVIIQHTVSTECYTFKNCAAEMRILQNYFIKKYEYDIPYNFLIGNDGRVYEGRGWGLVGAHTQFYNRCALGIGFVGDYREEISAHATVSQLQVKRTQMLLDYGVLKGYLHPDFHILAAKDIQDTASPGSNLYNELRTWRHYNNGSNYINKSCEEMYSEFKDKDG